MKIQPEGPSYEIRMICTSETGRLPGELDTLSSRLRSFVLLGEAYPANDAPGVEIPGELALIVVTRHEHDDAPIVDVFEVYGGCGAQIAREGLCGLEHHFLADPGLRDLLFRARGAWPLSIHHGSLFFSVPSIRKGRTKQRDELSAYSTEGGTLPGF